MNRKTVRKGPDSNSRTSDPATSDRDLFDAATEYERLTGREALRDASRGASAAAVWVVNPWLDDAFRSLLQDIQEPRVALGVVIPFAAIDPLPEWTHQPLRWWSELRDHGLVAPEADGLVEIAGTRLLRDMTSDPPLKGCRALLEVERGLRTLSRYEQADPYSILAEPIVEVARLGLADASASSEAMTASTLPLDLACRIMKEAREFADQVKTHAASPKPKGAPRQMVHRAFYVGVSLALRPEKPTGKHLALLAAAVGFEPVRDKAALEKAAQSWSMRINRFESPRPKVEPGAGSRKS